MLADSQKVLEVLRRARGLIEDPANWTRGMVGDRSGRVCAVGAVGRAIGLDFTNVCTPEYYADEAVARAHPAIAALVAVAPKSDIETALSPVARVNDEQGHAAVLALFDRAIERTEAEIRILSNLIIYEDEPTPDPTPNADAALAVMEACESAGEVVARQIVSMNPELDFDHLAEVAASELFYAAQDTAWAFEMGVKVER